MEKRPLSLTIIAVLLVLSALLALYGAFAIASTDEGIKMVEETGLPMIFHQLWTGLGAIITLVGAYGIWKGLPWSRVLYVLWSVVGLVVSFFISASPLVMLVSVILLVVVAAFLFSDKANAWFAARGFALTREDR